ncbi:MAG TPA: glycoside hydrolase family 38 C-terminal domain-containing protein, partial [Abditibacteriaceae bacterium]
AYRLNVGWYGCERDEITRRLDQALEKTKDAQTQNSAVFFGLGNHGGGPTRRHLDDVAAWASAHPEIEVRFSTLHGFFEALKSESAALPTHVGELNGCLRGCYSSAAPVKFAYRRAENAVTRAEAAHNIIGTVTGEIAPSSKLETAWDGVLFNSFHDILPGTSVERALDEQLDWIGHALHDARQVEFEALNRLARRVDTSVPEVAEDHPRGVSFLVWNPHPVPFHGPVELENCLDYRPIFAYGGRPDEIPLEVRGPNGDAIPFQRIETENDFLANIPWRRRVLIDAQIPALGYGVYTLGWVEGAENIPAQTNIQTTENSISNESFTVTARVGDAGISIERDGQPLLGGAGLSALTIEDEWGTWGGMEEQAESLDLGTVRAQWQVTQVQVLESGPLRAKMWVRLAPVSGSSWLDLTLSLSHGRNAVDASARVLWNERAARLKLVLPFTTLSDEPRAEFQVPGGSVTRGMSGEVPGGRWARVAQQFGFASDALYNFDLQKDALRTTVVRATRYATDRVVAANEEMWRPALDVGELKFRFVLAAPDEDLSRIARELERPVGVHATRPQSGNWPRAKSFLELDNSQLELLSLDTQSDQLLLCVQNRSDSAQNVSVRWDNQTQTLGEIAAFDIRTFALKTKTDS